MGILDRIKDIGDRMKLGEKKDISKLLDDVGLVTKTTKRVLELDPMVLEDPQVKELLLPYIKEEKYDKLKDVYKKLMETYNSPHEVK